MFPLARTTKTIGDGAALKNDLLGGQRNSSIVITAFACTLTTLVQALILNMVPELHQKWFLGTT